MTDSNRAVFDTLKKEWQKFLLNLVYEGMNQTNAYFNAYPDSSIDAAKSSSSELLNNPNVSEAYKELKAELKQRAQVDHDWCLEKLVMLVSEGTTNPGTDNQGAEKSIDINAVKGVINEINKMQGHHAAIQTDNKHTINPEEWLEQLK